VRQSPIIVRLGTDSVNPFRQQIYKLLVSVALKPQTAKPPAASRQPTASSPPYDASLGRAFLGVSDPERSSVGSDQESIQLRPLTSYGNSSSLAMLGLMPLGRLDIRSLSPPQRGQIRTPPHPSIISQTPPLFIGAGHRNSFFAAVIIPQLANIRSR
jgi:hypothetical protein